MKLGKTKKDKKNTNDTYSEQKAPNWKTWKVYNMTCLNSHLSLFDSQGQTIVREQKLKTVGALKCFPQIWNEKVSFILGSFPPVY